MSFEVHHLEAGGRDATCIQSTRRHANVSWTQLSEVNTSLRAQVVSMSVAHSLEQQDSSMRSPEDESLRVELAASLARESALGNELQTTRFEVQQFVSEN